MTHTNITIVSGKTGIGFGLLTIASFFTLIFSSFNKIEALLSPLGPITWLSATIIIFFGPSILSATDRVILRLGLTLGAGLTGLLVIYQQLGIASMFFSQTSEFVSPLFTPLGSPVALISYLVISIPISITIAKHALEEKNEPLSALFAVSIITTVLGIGITFWNYLGIATSQTLPLATGAQLLFTSWKSIPNLFFGIGIEKFFEFYTLHRQQTVNLSPIWNIGFMSNASFVLHIAITMGAVGLVGLSIFFFFLYDEWSKYLVTKIQMLIILLLALFAPPTLILVILTTLFILSLDPKDTRHIELPHVTRFSIAVITCILIGIAGYALMRWHTGERLMFASLQSAKTNNGSQAFILNEQAIKINPMNPSYHSILSQTATLLTESLVWAAPLDEEGKPKLTDEDTTLLTNLVGKSIQEAKLAITLSPTNVQSWLTLAKAYQGVLGIAKESDVWAIASYQKAITLDPTNPVIHLNLGGLYMSLKREEDAAKEFITALSLKPNYIDGYYNLANAFVQSGNWDHAIVALEQTKLLVAQNSTDSQKIDQEILSLLENKKKKGPPTQPTNLIVPRLKMP